MNRLFFYKYLKASQWRRPELASQCDLLWFNCVGVQIYWVEHQIISMICMTDNGVPVEVQLLDLYTLMHKTSSWIHLLLVMKMFWISQYASMIPPRPVSVTDTDTLYFLNFCVVKKKLQFNGPLLNIDSLCVMHCVVHRCSAYMWVGLSTVNFLQYLRSVYVLSKIWFILFYFLVFIFFNLVIYLTSFHVNPFFYIFSQHLSLGISSRHFLWLLSGDFQSASRSKTIWKWWRVMERQCGVCAAYWYVSGGVRSGHWKGWGEL